MGGILGVLFRKQIRIDNSPGSPLFVWIVFIVLVVALAFVIGGLNNFQIESETDGAPIQIEGF